MLAFSAMLALVVFVTLVGLRNLDSIHRHTQIIVDNHIAKIMLVTTMSSSARQRIVTMQKMTLIEDPFDRDELAMHLDALASRFAQARLTLVDMPLTAAEQSLLAEQGKRTGAALPVQRKFIDLLGRDNIEEAQEMLINDAIPAQDRVQEILEVLYNYQQDASNQAVVNDGVIYASARTLMLWLSGGAILLGLIIAYFVIRKSEKSRRDQERHLAEIELMNYTLQAQSSSLEDATERAQQANQFKSAFLANMSHEIRTPLTAIIGFSEILKDSNAQTADREYAGESIARNGKHLVQIINDVLDISKIEAGKLDIEPIPVALLGLVEEVESATALLANNKDIAFQLHYDFPLPERLVTDPTRLRQILINLINNAIKFTAEGGVSLRVSASPDGGHISFAVSDTGIGMTEEQLGKVFDKFSQADLSTTRRYGGTGLGLSICRHLAKKLNGDLHAESIPGEGSCVTLKMKLEMPAGSKQLICEPEGNAAGMHRSDDCGEYAASLPGRILLAEDNADNQRLISLYIRTLGAEVEIANNGEEAVELALTNDFDIIFMDMQMPVMDGVDATRMLRSVGYSSPIVALTANAMQQDVDRCMEAGCNAFLAKPIDRVKFCKVLKELLHDRGTTLAEHACQQEASGSQQGDYEALVARFLEGLPEWISASRSAAAAGDWTALGACLHDMKGMGGGFGFPEITRSAAATETLLNNGESAAVLQQLDALVSSLEDILSRYSPVLESGATA